MSVRLVGANPGVTLHSDERAVVFGDATGTRVIGPDPELIGWLANNFTRYCSR